MFDLYTPILDSDYGEELDEERLEKYIHEVMTEFETSPEAEVIITEFDTSLCWPATYMHYAAQYFGATPATVTPGETAEILFDIFPRKVSVEPDAAQQIVAELRAFWQFLKRTRCLEKADAMLEMLTDEYAECLEGYLADSSNFGMAKSMVMAEISAGYDMTDPDEMNRFMLAYNESLLEKFTLNDVDDADDAMASPATLMQPVAPIRNESQRVGRNEPCPCGSGRKYKKCCLRKGAETGSE